MPTDLDANAPAPAVDHDHPCIKCGYNLRTLPTNGRCPECARPVADSLLPDDLAYAPIEWLRHMRRGFRLLFVASFLFLMRGCRVLADPVDEPSACGLAFVVALFILGVVLATHRMPQRVTDRGRWLRHSARGAAALFAAAILTRVAAVWIVPGGLGRFDSVTTWLAWVGFACALLALLIHVRCLFDSDSRRHLRAPAVASAALAALGLGALLAAIGAVVQQSPALKQVSGGGLLLLGLGGVLILPTFGVAALDISRIIHARSSPTEPSQG